MKLLNYIFVIEFIAKSYIFAYVLVELKTKILNLKF